MSDKKNFLLYTVGRFISLFGDGMQSAIVSLFILSLTGSVKKMGLFFLYLSVINIIFLPISGVISDKFNRKKLMVILDILNGSIFLILGFLISKNNINIYTYTAFATLLGIFGNIYSVSTSAMLPNIVSKDYLLKATSSMVTLFSINVIISPAIGGFLYATIGIKYIFLFNGISFIASAIIEMFIKYKHLNAQKKLKIKNIFNDYFEGLKYVNNNKSIRYYVFLVTTFIILLRPLFTIVYPILIKDTLKMDLKYFGLVSSLLAVGTLTGSIIVKKIKNSNSVKNSILIQTLSFFVLAFLTSFNVSKYNFIIFPIVCIVTSIFGFAIVLRNIPINVFIQKNTENEFLGRVFSVRNLLQKILTTGSILLYSIVFDKINISYGLLIFGTINLLFFLIFNILGNVKNIQIQSEEA
ncbi:MFS transporter [Tepiditoga spiralis]|uniref:MFS transporter n=1 Tax=Tepiditoga spiralis TaxID=2108365 RepID=A0A7G1G529_9BACT|nr:MFS transporter [Tepiditoga spiralis]BBE29893.1 MFS transporter [Tepiditoga spiralis]